MKDHERDYQLGAGIDGTTYSHGFLVEEVEFLINGGRDADIGWTSYCEGRIHAIITKGLLKDE